MVPYYTHRDNIMPAKLPVKVISSTSMKQNKKQAPLAESQLSFRQSGKK